MSASVVQISTALASRPSKCIAYWESVRITMIFFGLLAIMSLALLGFGEGATSVAGFIFLIFSSMMLALQMRQRAYDQMVQELVTPEHNNQIQPTDDVSAD